MPSRLASIDTVFDMTKVSKPSAALQTYGQPDGHASVQKAKYGGRSSVAMLMGGGVSPEMMSHVKSVFTALKAPVDFDEINIADDSDEATINEAILAVQRNGVAIKGSLKTPPGMSGLPA